VPATSGEMYRRIPTCVSRCGSISDGSVEGGFGGAFVCLVFGGRGPLVPSATLAFSLAFASFPVLAALALALAFTSLASLASFTSLALGRSRPSQLPKRMRATHD